MPLFFDIFSGTALLLLSPLLLPLMFIFRMTAEGEIFFPQNRVGGGGKDFKLYKVATMLKDNPDMGISTVTVKNDTRILLMGGLLRKTKINKLPGLINMFNGDMSVIGHPPQTQRCFDAFPESAQNDIIKVRPGLSGIGSVVFISEENILHANAEPDRLYDDAIMPYKCRVESRYVRNKSGWNYLVLLVLIFFVILTRSTRLISQCYTSLLWPPEDLSSFIASDYDE